MNTSPTFTWDNLFEELVTFVFSKVKDKPLAENIVQDVLIKVHTKYDQLKEADKISGWIYQITRNAIADHFRSNLKSIKPVDVNGDGDFNEFNECVARCLALLITRLPDKYRIPLELTEIENRSQLEVAERLNITHSGARSRVQRARKLLKEKMNELYLIKTDSYGNVIACEDRVFCCCRRNC